MKSRYKKEMKNINKISNVVVFSKEKLFSVGDKVKHVDFLKDTTHSFALTFYDYFPKARERYDYTWSDFCMDLDNSILTKGQHVYILKTLDKDSYEVLLEENITDWREDYWAKEDPLNKRDWAYIDEDVLDVYNYLQGKYAGYLRPKHKKLFKKFVQTEIIYK